MLNFISDPARIREVFLNNTCPVHIKKTKKNKNSRFNKLKFIPNNILSFGAHSRTRTGTSLRTRDFKSLASTYSAKWANLH